ncbi:MAG TPA: c-type cytochrome [Mesorhizobium sp.]|jgi:mono/diheme cytochrome c family protein|nr:c-type cytochrome [Mesorhizobium sp.]
MNGRSTKTGLAGLALVSASWLTACSESPEPPTYLHVAGGVAEQGHRLVHAYGCGACHVIEGVRGARGTVGPSLENYAERSLLAGILPNTPEHLVPWLINPVAFDPQSGMPPMGLSEAEARHIAAYLYTLGGERTEIYPGGPPLALSGREEPVLQAGDQPTGGPDRADTTPRTRRLQGSGAQGE